MAERTNPSLHTLPLPLLHRIVQHLDDFTLFCTVPNICQNLNTIVENSDRYKVERRSLHVRILHVESISRLVAHYAFINTQKTWPRMDQSSRQHTEKEQSRTNHLLCIFFHLTHMKTVEQTLLNLDIGVNELDDESMFYVANALEQNQVIDFDVFDRPILIGHPAQALLIFNLQLNKFGPLGTEYLAKSLYKKSGIFGISSTWSLYCSSVVPYRHWLRWMYISIRSAMTEPSILLTRCAWIRFDRYLFIPHRSSTTLQQIIVDFDQVKSDSQRNRRARRLSPC